MVFKAFGETVFNFMFVTIHIFKVDNFVFVFKCIVRDGSIYLSVYVYYWIEYGLEVIYLCN